MNWAEYLKENDNKVEKNIVYITDVRVADGGNKFIRNVPPTKVQITSNEYLPKGKTIYYSEFHFLGMKGDKVLKKIIAPYDNTGNKWYTGISVNIFESERECILFYNKQIDEACEIYECRIKEIEIQRDKIKALKIGGIV